MTFTKPCGKILLLIALVSFDLNAQDYHLSQYDVAKLYLNPALTAFPTNGKDYSFTALQRSQWRSIGVKPFLTSYASFETPIQQKERAFGVGGYILNNNGGLGNINTLSVLLSGAYDILQAGGKKVNTTAGPKHMLAVGLQMGLFYRTNNTNGFTYDAQYSAGTDGSFDKAINNNEVYNKSSITRFDANYGIFYKMLDVTKKVRPSAGMSIAHLTKPNESLTSQKSSMPLKWTFHGDCEISVNEKTAFRPRILYMAQAKSTELMIGILGSQRMQDLQFTLTGGVDIRVKDAMILSVGGIYKKCDLRFSYDINTSYLKNYSKGRGAFEISLIYHGYRDPSKQKSAEPNQADQ